MTRDLPRDFDARFTVWRFAGVFQRIAWAHQPPHLIEPKPLQGREADMAVRRVRRVERAAEQPDAHVGRRHRHLEVLCRVVALLLTHVAQLATYLPLAGRSGDASWRRWGGGSSERLRQDSSRTLHPVAKEKLWRPPFPFRGGMFKA